VNVPQTGYVGVGKVVDTARKADEVSFKGDGKEGNIYELSKNAGYHKQYIQDEDKAEYMVRIEWIKTVFLEHAIKEVGFFGNQNTVCKPSSSKWTHTVDRLKDLWKIVYKDFVFGKIQNMPIEGKAHFYFALPFLRII
jgi:hypothetical protein